MTLIQYIVSRSQLIVRSITLVISCLRHCQPFLEVETNVKRPLIHSVILTVKSFLLLILEVGLKYNSKVARTGTYNSDLVNDYLYHLYVDNLNQFMLDSFLIPKIPYPIIAQE